LKELALSVSTDPDHRFDLAISLNDLETALDLVRSAPEAGSQAKWKLVGDKALSAWQMDLAQESFEKANDLPALLLLYTSLSDRTGLTKLASLASEKGATNIAFAAYLQLGDSQACIDILAKTGRLPEAALFARSYNTKAVPGVVKQWKKELEGAGKGKVAEIIADPEEDSDLFPEGNGGEGSGIMVENEGESQQGYDLAKEEPSTTGDVAMTDSTSTESKAEAEPVAEVHPEEEEEHKKTSEKVKEKVEHAKDKVEGLVEKVKDLADGDGTSFSTSSLFIPSPRPDSASSSSKLSSQSYSIAKSPLVMKLINRLYTFYGWKEEEGQEVELLSDIGVEIDCDSVLI
jgi:coatomer subunit beta'